MESISLSISGKEGSVENQQSYEQILVEQIFGCQWAKKWNRFMFDNIKIPLERLVRLIS